MKADLSRIPAALKTRPSQGRCIMFISALAGEGVSKLARQAAREWPAQCAIDLDVRRNGLARTLVAEGAKLGPPLPRGAASATLFRAVDAQGRILSADKAIFMFHRVDGIELCVGAFHPKALPEGARVRVSNAPRFWDDVRAIGVTAVVDAPALARSKVGLVVAKHMDGVVLVVGDDEGAAPAAINAKEALQAVGANLLGLVYTTKAPARLLKRAS